MTTVIDGDVIDRISGLMDVAFTVEGAVFWLLDANPHFGGDSVASLLLNGEGERVLETLRSIVVEA